MTHLFYSRSSEICKRFKLAAEIGLGTVQPGKGKRARDRMCIAKLGDPCACHIRLAKCIIQVEKRSNVRYYSACTCERVNVMTDEWFE